MNVIGSEGLVIGLQQLRGRVDMVVSIAMPDVKMHRFPIPSSVGRPIVSSQNPPCIKQHFKVWGRGQKGGPGVALGVSPEIGYVSELPGLI